MNQALQAILQDAFGAEPSQVYRMGGGLNQTAHVVIGRERYFIKWNPDAQPGFFEAEARGLDVLRSTGIIRVPQVIRHAERSGARPAYLALEYLEQERPTDPGAFAQNLGSAVAQLHHVTAPAFGLDHDNFIGALPQANTPTAQWADFYRDQRILPQMALARNHGLLPSSRENRLTRLLNRLDDLLAGKRSTPSLLHGDLWSGNFLSITGNLPAFVDPAVYYGEREVEIAFTQLFGGFPTGFLNAYQEVYPLDSGYEERRLLYQLYPLLVHLNLFGESYGAQVDAACRHFVG